MLVTRHPPHRSLRADFPHRAPASGSDAQAFVGIRVVDLRLGKPAFCYQVHAVPGRPLPLATTSDYPFPVTEQMIPKCAESATVAWHPIVSVVPHKY